MQTKVLNLEKDNETTFISLQSCRALSSNTPRSVPASGVVSSCWGRKPNNIGTKGVDWVIDTLNMDTFINSATTHLKIKVKRLSRFLRCSGKKDHWFFRLCCSHLFWNSVD